MSTTTDSTAPDVRQGLAGLLEWLHRHPGVRIANADYVDEHNAEVWLPEGLSSAVQVAGALTGASIEALDRPGKSITEVRVAGATVEGAQGIAVTATLVVYDRVRARLLASLGTPPDPTVRVWPVSVAHLRGLVEVTGTAVGA